MIFYINCAVAADLNITSPTLQKHFYFTAGNSSASQFKVKLSVSCFGTNLRSVANPVSPTGAIRLRIGIGPNSNPTKKDGSADFTLLFPGWMVMAKGKTTEVVDRSEVFDLTRPELKGGTATGAQNQIIFRLPTDFDIGLSSEKYTAQDLNATVKYVNFSQDIQGAGNCWGRRMPISLQNAPSFFEKFFLAKSFAGGGGMENFISNVGTPDDSGWGQPTACNGVPGWDMAASAAAGVVYSPAQIAQNRNYYQRYMGHDGALSGVWDGHWSSDLKSFEMKAAFPGEFRFCGGYFSPLMLFFSSVKPEFTARKRFALTAGQEQTAWIEKGQSSAFFLALDLNKNGKIDNGTELFGEEEQYSNGFEKLAQYDLNHDGVIDRLDPIYFQLKVWDGWSSKLFSLSQKLVESINLNFTFDSEVPVGNRARLRQKSSFVIRDGETKKTREVFDVWFNSSAD